jgi:hypothetical protein
VGGLRRGVVSSCEMGKIEVVNQGVLRVKNIRTRSKPLSPLPKVGILKGLGAKSPYHGGCSPIGGLHYYNF